MTASEPTLAGADRRSPVLSIENLTVELAGEHGHVRVLDDVNFEIGARETLGLVGESGSGKTITALSVMGLLPKSARIPSGSIEMEGEQIVGCPLSDLQRLRGSRMAMVFQEPMTSLNPAFTVGDQIGETVRRHRGASRRAARARAVEMLDLVGIPNAARRVRSYPHEFSGGMRQRVMMAIALACEPALLIADEPTTALDVTIQAQLLDLLRDLQDQLDLALLFITHDLGVVADICDRVMVMYAGQVIEGADAETLFEHPEHPYTEGLLRAMPHIETRSGELFSIPGSPPAPLDRPPGCAFNPRCGYAEPTCTADAPPLRSIEPNHTTRCLLAEKLRLQGVQE
ncbi:ABC transporter ATP-binding protein [Ilumatobacter nonamiensis]|uniref:ABC transporter ATP-binding protein n=1 Tax=Ilumatobacter nonamiensis TaxID=467093 RepID=UPI000347703A|nr:ABC transporter ATP-binding protein [Ilumatobacter nonamiensis]